MGLSPFKIYSSCRCYGIVGALAFNLHFCMGAQYLGLPFLSPETPARSKASCVPCHQVPPRRGWAAVAAWSFPGSLPAGLLVTYPAVPALDKHPGIHHGMPAAQAVPHLGLSLRLVPAPRGSAMAPAPHGPRAAGGGAEPRPPSSRGCAVNERPFHTRFLHGG